MGKIKLDSNSEQNILNMLLEGSSLSSDQMSKINATSPEIGKTKLETAIELNFTDEKKIQKVLSSSYSLDLISLDKKVIDPKIKKIIDIRYIQDNFLVPFEMSGGVLKIAIADASKLGLMKNLKTMTKMEPELYAATISDINDFIERMSKMDTKKHVMQKWTCRYLEFSPETEHNKINLLSALWMSDNLKKQIFHHCILSFQRQI